MLLRASFKTDDLYYISTLSDPIPFNITLAGRTLGLPDYTHTIRQKTSVYYTYQFEYITEGCGYIDIGENRYNVKEGDFIFINKNVLRSFTTDREHPLKKLYFSISGKIMDAVLEEYGISNNIMILNMDLREEFEAIIKKAESSDAPLFDLCNELGMMAIDIVQKVHKQNKSTCKSPSALTAENIKQYIDENISKNITLEDLCTTFFLGKTQLIKIFSRKYNVTPIKYLQMQKITAAQAYLEARHVKTAKLAELLGFSDAVYFSKVFKKYTGMTLGQYKKKKDLT